MNELSIEMTDGFSLYAFILKPEGKPVGHVHILHGMAEHSGRYREFAQNLAANGYIVSSHDHRGHGRTVALNGMRGHFTDEAGFDRVVEDAFEAVTFFRESNSAPRFILFGHSMGSFIGRRFIQTHGDVVDLAIFSGTGGNPGVARYAGKAVSYLSGKRKGFNQPNEFLDSLVFGGFNKGIDKPVTKFDWISKDRDIVESYVRDKYCGFIPTTQFFSDLFDGLGMIHKKKEIKKIRKTLPILLFSGLKDPVGDFGKAVWKVAKAYNRAGIEDVTVLLYDEGRHEILNDTEQEEATQKVLDWMANR
ncbi:alpha/beta hydrolase [Sporosarcina sp. G11-34]|uniref:alpha/beta hydrolase n=1 Tax=Sporosarcina sp. G11-34 TaxID=2849605 RepID=UPI0022A96091|nr:alpha/beta hydrolase [Sporosarcina sp. G11-34]MCZ2258745.1 alpha/beta hydrolase [Sporosarcina sp. G11-34]